MEQTKQKRRAGTIIFDDLAFKLTPSERIIFGIIHRFAGYKLGECRLKPNKIAELAGVSRSTVYNATKHLVDLGMVRVIRHQKSSGAFYRALEVVRADAETLPKLTGEEIEELETKVIDNGRAAYEKQPVVVIDTEVQDLAKKLPEQAIQTLNRFGNSDVNALLDFWLQEVGTPITSRVQANRRAAANLLRKHGPAAVQQAIKIAAQARFSEYAVTIANFVDLQAHWDRLHLWAEKRAHAALMDKYEAMSIEDRVKFKEANPELAQIIKQKRSAM